MPATLKWHSIGDLVRKVDVPEGQEGDWSIKQLTITEDDVMMHNLRERIRGGGREIPPGTYTRLLHKGCVVMSDTPAEMRDHWEPVREAKRATGEIDVLINGLGIGMVLQAMLDIPNVRSVTVIEISQEVINLVKPHYVNRYGDKRLEVHWADALIWKPPANKRYAVVWHDIWNSICADNLEEMKTLHRRYGRRCEWQGSWCRWLCERNR